MKDLKIIKEFVSNMDFDEYRINVIKYGSLMALRILFRDSARKNHVKDGEWGFIDSICRIVPDQKEKQK